jgi:hypothetical protein
LGGCIGDHQRAILILSKFKNGDTLMLYKMDVSKALILISLTFDGVKEKNIKGASLDFPLHGAIASPSHFTTLSWKTLPVCHQRVIQENR